MLIEDFNRTVDTWIKELDHYNLIQLCLKPSPASWSLGQVYFHLVKNTSYYIEEIKVCLSAEANMDQEKSPEAVTMFRNNEFPDAVIEGPDTNVETPQPGSKEELMNALLNLKHEMNRVYCIISNSHNKGKTKHPGLGYFSADDWLQFAEMHLRHHLRQKKRIDDFFKVDEY
ncbi:MAG: DinB family protein [Chitinophagales bacterium]